MLKAKDYVWYHTGENLRNLLGWQHLSLKFELSKFVSFDSEIRKLAVVAPNAECYVYGDAVLEFMADFTLGSDYLVLTYGEWKDGEFCWNLQRNTDVDGPEGVEDLVRSMDFSAVMRFLRKMANAV